MPANDLLKGLAISIVASALTSTLVVWLLTDRGVPAPPPVPQAAGPDLELQASLDDLTARVEQLSLRLLAQESTLAGHEQALAQRTSESVTATARHAAGAATETEAAEAADAQGVPDTETQLRAALDDFEFLGKVGLAAYNHPRAQQLIERLRALGAEGRALLVDELNHEDQDRRFAAAAVAEGLKDPALVEPLEHSALQDESFLVRRMSSHALAFLGDEAAGDSLVRVIENETRDAGVLLNSWYGLATLQRPEAVSSFARVLDHAGGDLPADFVVDTALKISDREERLLGTFEISLARDSVSLAMKSRVLSTLARSNTSASRQLIQRVADDAAAPAELREQAQRILTGG